jgi:tight adherence protein B
MLPVLSLLIFVVTLGFVMSGFYFFVEAPVARKKLMTRLSALEQVSLSDEKMPELFRNELLSRIPLLNRILISMPGVPKLTLFLQQAAVRMQVGTFILLVVAISFGTLIAGLVTGVSFPMLFLAVIGFPLVPFVVVSIMRSRRFSRLEELFPEAMDLLARAVRAGHAFTSGFELIGNELPDPLGEEFRITYQQQNLGLPLREALGNLAVRVPLPDVRIFVSAIQIQRDSGGNLGEILDTLSAVVRERFKLLRQVKVFTAEGRMSQKILSSLPVVAFLGLYMMNPGYLEPLFTDPIGQYGFAVVLLMQVVGYMVIRKIIRIEV